MTNKIISYLGFAQKSGKAVIGADNIIDKHKNYKLILVDNAASERLKKDIIGFAKDAIPIEYVDDLQGLTNRNGCKAFAVLDENLAAAIIENLRGNV